MTAIATISKQIMNTTTVGDNVKPCNGFDTCILGIIGGVGGLILIIILVVTVIVPIIVVVYRKKKKARRKFPFKELFGD
jgi:uncharacterized membrane protein